MTNKREVKDVFSVEERIRTPIKGVRVRFRTAIRALGIKDKFRTDILRPRGGLPPRLVVITKEYFDMPLTEFEGMPVEIFIKV